MCSSDLAFTGPLTLTGYSSLTTRVAVWVNGVRQGEVTLPALSGTRHAYDSSAVTVNVPKGLVAIRLEVLSGDLVVCSVNL